MGRCARGECCAHAELVEYDQCAGDCDCHLGPHYACSVPGGCGHLHSMASTLLGAITEPYDHGMCRSCTSVITDAVIDLPADYNALRTAQHRGISPATGELVMATKDLPVPISLTLATLAEQIEVEVTAFVEPVAEKLCIDWDKATTPRARTRYGPPPKYTGIVVLKKAARLLGNAMDTLLLLPPWEYRLWGDDGWIEVEATGIEAALTLLSLHQATRATLGLTKATITMQAECPWCHVQSLIRVAGEEYIRCHLCSFRMESKEYNQYSLVLIGDKKAPKRARRRSRRELHASAEGAVGRPVCQEA
jgi:hypothetical protein